MTTTTRRRVGIAGAIVGAASAGVAAAALAKRYAVGRIRLRPDLDANEPFGELGGTEHTLTTSDGKALHVEVDGPHDAPADDRVLPRLLSQPGVLALPAQGSRDTHRMVL